VRNLPLLIAVLLIGVLCTLAVLFVTGNLNGTGSGNGKNGAQEEERPEGTIPIIVPRVTIPAYAKVSREHLYAKDGRPMVMYIPEDQVPPGTLTRTDEVLGRVLSRDKAPGLAFHENDFMPEGTRPGAVAGIPPGKRGVVVKANRVEGAYALNIGDRFDLVSLEPEEEMVIGPDGKLVANPAAARRRQTDSAKRPVLLSRGAIVVRQVTARQEFYEHRGGLVGARVDIRTKPVEEITIAVDPSEVGEVVKALDGQAIIVALARSGQVGDISNEIPEFEPTISEYLQNQSLTGPGGAQAAADAAEEKAVVRQTVIEAIVGQEKTQVVFVGKDDSGSTNQ